MVLPVFVLVVFFFALLISYPWQVLTVGSLIYLACLPLGWWSHREYQRKDAASFAAASAPAGEAQVATGSIAPGHDTDHDRPPRLN
jgi:CDP-diacylglycerol--serine O-phosphatidyltransferase